MPSFQRYLFFVGVTSTAIYMIYKFVKTRFPEEDFSENVLAQLLGHHSYSALEDTGSVSSYDDVPVHLPASEAFVSDSADASDDLQKYFQGIGTDEVTDVTSPIAGIVTPPPPKKRKRFRNLRKMFSRLSCVHKAR